MELIHPYTVWPSVGVPEGEGEQSGGWSRFAVILPRQGATVGNSSLALLRHVENLGTPLLNRVSAIVEARDKFRCAQVMARAQLPVPPTFLVNTAEGMRSAVETLGGYPVVVKPAADRQGEGVHMLRGRGDSESLLTGEEERRAGLLVQHYYPSSRRRDLRLVVIGGRVAGVVELTLPARDFRSNVHVGGHCTKVSVGAEWKALAVEATRTLGWEVAGVDLIVDSKQGAMVLEVNYSPGFQAFEAATGLDLAGQVIGHAVTLCTAPGRVA